MTSEWGRSNAAGRWLSTTPVWIAGALTLAVMGALATATYHLVVVWTPRQRTYASAYVRCVVLESVGVTTPGRYRLLQVVTPTGHRLPLDQEVRSGEGGGLFRPLVLTDLAVQIGDTTLVWEAVSYQPAALRGLLERWVYSDRTMRELLMPALWVGFAIGALGLLVAIPQELRRSRFRRQGKRLKGPELVSVTGFNRGQAADGITFGEPAARNHNQFRRALGLRIPKAIESSHFLIVGDSGTGKSTLIRQLLAQLAARGESAIVYDPALEYTGQFYDPDRGDLILNPLDQRCPYWTPTDEWRHEAETLTLATSLFPDRHQENPFFTEAPRRIFAYLLTRRPQSPADLAHWLCHDHEIDVRVVNTPYASMIDRQAPAQRAGVLASLNMVADTLKLLPKRIHTTARWSATAWSTDRKGWLFLTSTPETRPQLTPLTSLWLDTLVLRLMNQGRPSPRTTWFVLDELASLQRLPQLHTAMTENRKSNNPVVLGFQGRSQIETRYGHDAEAILSQPATKIFLRTSEPRAAKWVSETIGDVEIERLRESRSSGRGQQQSYGLERQVEPLVMASEIAGLPALHGFLKLGNRVVRLIFPFVAAQAKAPAFVERAPVRADTTREVTMDLPPAGDRQAHAQQEQRFDQCALMHDRTLS